MSLAANSNADSRLFNKASGYFFCYFINNLIFNFSIKNKRFLLFNELYRIFLSLQRKCFTINVFKIVIKKLYPIRNN